MIPATNQQHPDSKYILLFLLILIGCLFAISSCTGVRKLSKNVKTEFVKTEQSNKTESKDSATKTVTKVIDSTGTSITIEYDSAKNDSATTIDIITYPPSKDQYFERVQVKSSIKPKSIKVNQAKKKTDEKAAELNVKSAKADENKKEEKKTVVDKGKSQTKFKISWLLPIGLLLLIVLLILAYKNRTCIGNWIKNIFSLIKFI